MRFYFRPFPGLTIFTVISLIILISLGTWQYHRLQWKTELLAEIEASANAAPFESLVILDHAYSNQAPIDFRRIEITAKAVPIDSPFHVYKVSNKGIAWNQFVPFRESLDGVFINVGSVDDAQKDEVFPFPEGEQIIAGYIRKARKPGWLAPKNTPEKNRWFGFNPMPETHDWGKRVNAGIETAYYIDASDGAVRASDLPVKRPDIRNNHLDYMLTWYSFAVILLIIYFILHYRRGRIGRKLPQ